MRARSLAPLLPLLLVMTTTGPALGVQAVAAPSCDHEVATIVGTVGQRLTGTDQRDVIVTGGAEAVLAGRGDDLVCVTGDTAHVAVEGGPGDDTVDGTATTVGITVDGGDGSDVVTTDRGADSVIVDGHGSDTISTGRGNDTVVGHSAEGWTADGGEGHNTLIVYGGPQSTGDNVWDIDVPTGVATLDQTTAFTFHGFTDVWPWVNRSPGDVLHLRGSAEDEQVLMYNYSRGHLDLDLGGGDDAIGIGMWRTDVARVSGGPGRDSINIGASGGDLRADLTTGAWDVAWRSRTIPHRIAGFESLRFGGFASAFLRGTNRAESVSVGDSGCPTLLGGGGDDVLSVETVPDRCGVRLVGGAGDDRLSGSGHDDVLLGGPGDDTADGEPGRDRCRAETRISCERR